MSIHLGKKFPELLAVERDKIRITPALPVLHVLLLDGPEDFVEQLKGDFVVQRVEPNGVAPPNRCVLAVAIALDRPDVRSTLMAFSRRSPLALLIVITSGDRSNLKNIAGLNAYDVVTPDRVMEELPEIVARARERDLLETAASAIEEDDALDGLLRLALVAAFRSIVPIHTAKRLASLLDKQPKRLSEVFRDARRRTGWHWPDVLEAITLWHVINLMAAKHTLKATYEELGLSDRTMRRVCLKHLGCRPSELLHRQDRLGQAIVDFVAGVLTIHSGEKN